MGNGFLNHSSKTIKVALLLFPHKNCLGMNLTPLGLLRLKWRLLWVLEMKLVDSAKDATRNVPSSLWADELILG